MCNDSLLCCVDGFPFGDLDAFWNRETPTLPTCFTHTVLIWLPCAVFWLTFPFEIAELIGAKGKNQGEKRLSERDRGRRRFLLVARVVGLLLLMITSVIRVAAIRNIDNATSTVLSAFILYPVTVISLIIITILRYRRLVAPPSAYAWLTLCVLALLAVPELVSNIQYANDDSMSAIGAGSFFIQYASILISLLMFSISDPSGEEDTREWPEELLSFPNILVFWWFFRLLIKGYRNVLSMSDMFVVSKNEQTRPVYEAFEKNLRRHFGRQETGTRKTEPSDWSMIVVLMRTFYKPMLAAAVLELISASLTFVSPLGTVWLMKFASDKDEPNWHGFVYVGVLFAAILFRSFATQFRFHLMNKAGVRARAAVVAAVYRKALTMSSEARRISNTGEIVNLMAVDSATFIDVAPWLQLLWSAPFQVCFGLYFIYTAVGHAVWAGVGVMAIIFTCTSIVSKQMQKLQTKQMYEKDKRIKLVSEMLNGMKVVKLYAWEPAFERLAELIRAKELKFLKISGYLEASVTVSYCCTNLMSCVAIFGTYCFINPAHNVTAETAFLAMTVFTIINVPFTQLPLAASSTMTTLASITRLRKYFCGGDLISYIESRQNSELPIEIEKASFAWEIGAKYSLNDISLSVKPGQLVAVVGSVGSGKSSLINAVCGEMQKRSGSIFVNGTVAYVAQQAWIQNLSVRDNILFGLPYDEVRYQKIIQACELKPDLALMANGDTTIIGERGSNLSGGQKQRISLARAVYQNADIYLLDDPLSAVDVHVGKSIFDKVIGPNGLLAKKARIFVTHGINYLPLCDSVVLMENGRFTAVGSFSELAKKVESYAEFIEKNVMTSKEDASPMKKMSNADIVTRVLSRQLSGGSAQELTAPGIILKRLSSFQSQISVVSDRLIKPGVDDEVTIDSIEEEEIHVGKIGWRTYWRYAKYSGISMLLHLIFVLLAELCYMGGNMWLEIWTDSVSSEIGNMTNDSTANVSTKRVISSEEGIGVLGAFTVAQFVLTLFFAIFYVQYLMKASTAIHKSLLGAILRAPMSFFDTTPSGRLTNRFGKDMNTVDNQIPMSTTYCLQSFVLFLTFVLPIFYAMPVMLVVVFPLLGVYFLIQKFYVTSSRQFRRLEAISRSPIYSHFQESIHGIATIRAYNRQSRFAAESDRLVDINDSVQMTLLTSNRWLGIQLDFIGNLIIVGASLTAVLSRNTMLPGLVGLAISYALGITSILNYGVTSTALLETEVVAVERISEYIDTTAPEAEWTSSDSSTISSTKNWPSKGAVEFRDYATSYRPGLPLVLRDFSCRILAGEKVGVVGRTGAGKSSLTLALFRLLEPTSGAIFIDDVDISRLGLHDLRRKLTIIPQEPVLFSGTLRQNIDPFEQYKDDELYRALELSHLTVFVASLDGGLSHEIAEGGANLSVGQRQLLCLARALLRKTKILILDEATASVDVETDALIQRTVREQFADCTVITIAHRLSTILDCDRVMVLDSGRLKEYNSPASLIDDEKSEFGRMIQEAGIRLSSNNLSL